MEKSSEVDSHNKSDTLLSIFARKRSVKSIDSFCLVTVWRPLLGLARGNSLPTL
jgi:hypothetical protein